MLSVWVPSLTVSVPGELAGFCGPEPADGADGLRHAAAVGDHLAGADEVLHLDHRRRPVEHRVHRLGWRLCRTGGGVARGGPAVV